MLPNEGTVIWWLLAVSRKRGRKGDYPLTDKDFEQVRELYRRVMSDYDRRNVVSNIAGSLGQALERIQYRQTALFDKADADYGQRVAEALGLDMSYARELAAHAGGPGRIHLGLDCEYGSSQRDAG